ncbi:MAG TPA: hypothetical protein VII58_03325 [Acidobacteriaceae bacterium]
MILPSLHKLSVLAVLSAAPLLAQTTTTPTWFTITQESGTTSVALPAGTTYRFGTANCAAQNGAAAWTQVTVSQPTTISPVSMGAVYSTGINPFPFADPCGGSVKELDVLETATLQTISVTNTVATPSLVAMVVPSLVPTTVVDATPGSNHTLTFTNFTVAPGSTQNALMFAFVNQPANNADNIWEGTQMNLTIDGVTLTCSYGQTYTSGVFTLSCTVPVTTTTTQTASN